MQLLTSQTHYLLGHFAVQHIFCVEEQLKRLKYLGIQPSHNLDNLRRNRVTIYRDYSLRISISEPEI